MKFNEIIESLENIPDEMNNTYYILKRFELGLSSVWSDVSVKMIDNAIKENTDKNVIKHLKVVRDVIVSRGKLANSLKEIQKSFD